MEMISYVKLRGDCLYTLLRAAIEEKTEPDLDIFGNNRNNVIKIVSAYPLRSVDSKPTSVDYNNEAAIRRLCIFNKAIKIPLSDGVDPKGKYDKLGQSHRHKGPIDSNHAGVGLGRDDLEEIEKRMYKFEMGEWLEIVMLTTFRKYQGFCKFGTKAYKLKNRVRFLVKGEERGEKQGFDIIVGAHYLYFDSRDRLKHYEVPVAVPAWNIKRT